MVSDWWGRDKIGGILPRLGRLKSGRYCEDWGILSRLGVKTVSDWGGVVRIGVYCQDWRSRSGDIAIGLGVYSQNWGHETPIQTRRPARARAARHQSYLSLYWGYKAPNTVHVLTHLEVGVDITGAICKPIGDIKLHATPKLTYPYPQS